MSTSQASILAFLTLRLQEEIGKVTAAAAAQEPTIRFELPLAAGAIVLTDNGEEPRQTVLAPVPDYVKALGEAYLEGAKAALRLAIQTLHTFGLGETPDDEVDDPTGENTEGVCVGGGCRYNTDE